MVRLAFSARLRLVPGLATATSIQVPKKVSARLPRGLVRIRGTVNGVGFRNAFFPTGRGDHYMVVNRDLKAKTGLGPGDTAKFVVEVDTRPRVVVAPADLRRAVQENPRALEYWKRLPPSHKKEYVQYVTEAKRPETRARRVRESAAMLAKQRPWDKL